MNELYYIALVPDSELSKLCLEYKLVAKELFHTQAALHSIVHITLVAPFKANVSTIEQVKYCLTSIVRQHQNLNLSLSGWQHFEQRTIYLGCESSLQLNQLYSECQNQIKQLVQLRQENQFVPHISIINRDLSTENFAAAWSYFSNKHYPAQTTCSQLVVFKHSPAQWYIDQYLNLSTTGNL